MDTQTLAALAEPNRLRIVELLRAHPYTVNEIAARLGLRQPQASKHLRILSDSGIVDAVAVAQQRIYHLEPKPFAELGDWAGSFEAVWNARLGNLDSYLQTNKTSKE